MGSKKCLEKNHSVLLIMMRRKNGEDIHFPLNVPREQKVSE